MRHCPSPQLPAKKNMGNTLDGSTLKIHSQRRKIVEHGAFLLRGHWGRAQRRRYGFGIVGDVDRGHLNAARGGRPGEGRVSTENDEQAFVPGKASVLEAGARIGRYLIL